MDTQGYENAMRDLMNGIGPFAEQYKEAKSDFRWSVGIIIVILLVIIGLSAIPTIIGASERWVIICALLNIPVVIMSLLLNLTPVSSYEKYKDIEETIRKKYSQ